MAVKWQYTEAQLRALASSPHAKRAPAAPILSDVAWPAKIPKQKKSRACHSLAWSPAEPITKPVRSLKRWVPKTAPFPGRRPFKKPGMVPISCFHISDQRCSTVAEPSTDASAETCSEGGSLESEVVQTPGVSSSSALYEASLHTGLTDSEDSDDEEEEAPRHQPPSVSLLLEHLDLPTFRELRLHTNLNIPPTNWLFNDARLLSRFNPARPPAPTGRAEFSSAMLAGPASLLMIEDRKTPTPKPKKWEVDFIASSESIKQLFMGPYTSSGLALSVHKVGSSLVLEGDLSLMKGVFSQKPHRKSTQEKMLESKFVYYSILADSQSSVSPAAAPTSQGKDLAVSTIVIDKNAGGAGTPELERRFCRTLHWQFRDLNLLLGSEAFIMKEPTEGTTVSLRLQDADEPLSQETALEIWLDNLMSNVPNVALCYHREGVVQGYQLISTQKLPRLAGCIGFDPKVVEEYAGSVLHWLKDRCTNEAGSYLLVREPGGNQLLLYDLTDLCGSASDGDEEAQPFQYSLGMMCYRMADKLLECKAPETQTEARRLLQRSVDLLHADQEPMVLAAAHEHLAQSYLSEGNISAGVEQSHASAPHPKKVRGKKVPLGQPNLSTGPSHSMPWCNPGLLVPKDSQRENTALAADHLVKALQILARVVLPDVCKYQEMKQMWHRSVRCYIDVAKYDSARGACGEAFRWIAKAQHVMLLLQREAQSFHLNHQVSQSVRPKDQAAEHKGGGAADTVSFDDAEADEQWRQESAGGILETLGDIHMTIGTKLQRGATMADKSSSSLLWLEEWQEVLSEVLAQQDAAARWDFLRDCSPLEGTAEGALRKALRFYTTARALSSQLRNNDPKLTNVLNTKILDTHATLAQLYTGDGRFSKAKEQLMSALQLATATENVTKTAALNLQLGEMHLQHATLLQSCAGSTAAVSAEEQKIIYSAMESFKRALNCDTDALRLTCEKRIGDAYLRLSSRLLSKFVTLIHDQPGTDWENTLEEMLHTAIKHFNTSSSTLGTAHAHCELGALYSIAFLEGYNPKHMPDITKLQEKRVKMSELYWRKAADVKTTSDEDDPQCPIMITALCGLAELEMRIYHRGSKTSARSLERALHSVVSTNTWFEANRCHPAHDSAAQTVLDTLKKVLMSLLKHKKATDCTELKQIYKTVLTALPADICATLEAIKVFSNSH